MSTSPNFYNIQNISSKHFTNTHVRVPIQSLRSRSSDLVSTASFTVSSSQSYPALTLRSVRDKFSAITAVLGSGGDDAGNGNRYGGIAGGDDDGTGGFDDVSPLMVPPTEYRSCVEERLLAGQVFSVYGAVEFAVKGEDEYENLKERFYRHMGKIFRADVTMAANATVSRLNWVTATELQAALAGTSHPLSERSGDFMVGTVMTSSLLYTKKAIHHELEEIPMSSIGVGYSFYIALYTDLGYQLLGGGVERQSFSHQHKLMLSAKFYIRFLIESRFGSCFPALKIIFRADGGVCFRSSQSETRYIN